MANIGENAILSFGRIVDGAKEYNFQTSSIYKLPSVSGATGITYISNTSFTGLEPLVKIEQLIRSGKLVRLTALVANPVDGEKNKTSEILCRADLAIAARTALVGKTLQIVRGGSTIVIGKVIKIRGRTHDRFN